MCNYGYILLLVIMISSDVRLISTDSRSFVGRIEVFYNNAWGQVCFQENNATLGVVCAQLGFGSFGVIPFRTGIPINSRIWLSDNINCNGNEDTIFDCLSPVEASNVGKMIGGICSNGAANVICPIRKFYIATCVCVYLYLCYGPI